MARPWHPCRSPTSNNRLARGTVTAWIAGSSPAMTEVDWKRLLTNSATIGCWPINTQVIVFTLYAPERSAGRYPTIRRVTLRQDRRDTRNVTARPKPLQRHAMARPWHPCRSPTSNNRLARGTVTAWIAGSSPAMTKVDGGLLFTNSVSAQDHTIQGSLFRSNRPSKLSATT